MSGMDGFHHISVMPKETIRALDIRPEGIYLDGTLGGGGHTGLIAERLEGKGRVIALDRDMTAIDAAGRHLEELGLSDRVTRVHENYVNAANVLKDIGIDGVDGILLDLGVSSPQIDDPARGFSYMHDAPLDMRMDKGESLTAKEIVNEWTEQELARIFKDYGEERFARQIAAAIVRERTKDELRTTFVLNRLIEGAVPKKAQKGGHPSKRVFQALRIACNDELNILETALKDMITLLKPQGRLAVITFHSLEDRIVKIEFRRQERPCSCPPDFPVCVCGKKPTGRVVTTKPLVPSREEVESNPRAKSAKLRVFEKGE